MSDENSGVERGWEDIICTFLKNKSDSEEEKYLKEVLKGVTEAFATNNWFEDEDIGSVFDGRKNKKSAEQTAIEFQRQRYLQAKNLQKQPDELDWHQIEEHYRQEVINLEKKYAPGNWIDSAAPNADSVSFATHVSKLTHSKIDSPSLMDEIANRRADLLTTSSLSDPTIDGAVAGNQFAPNFQFLELNNEGRKLAKELANEQSVALKPFASDYEQLRQWNQAFKKASVAAELSTHGLLKQVYFPVKCNEEGKSDYHLLTNMTSSSMAHTIFDRLFDDDQKPVRKQREKKKYSPNASVNYPQRAKIAVTASNHSNASQLNGRRGGRLHLLSAQPPTWRRRLMPPVKMKSWFDYGIPNYTVADDIEHLREFLLRFDTLDLSTRDPKRRRWMTQWGTSLVDEVLFLAGSIQTLPAGWSDDPQIRLKIEHQFFLDPFRSDESFQAKRQSSNWQSTICQDFALWLNKQLIGKDKKFTPQDEHTKLWASLMESDLRELEESFKAARKEAASATVTSADAVLVGSDSDGEEDQ